MELIEEYKKLGAEIKLPIIKTKSNEKIVKNEIDIIELKEKYANILTVIILITITITIFSCATMN